MEQIHITLPDGSVKDVPKGTTPADVARSISPRLADAALVARVAAPNDGEGELIDLRRPLDHDVKLQILTEKDPDSLFVFRHSAAHLLAAAVMELYPDVKLGIGPPIDTGFFYEFLREEPFTPDDLVKIESNLQVRTRRRKSRRADRFFLLHRQVHRLLPRPSHSIYQAHPGVQADERRRRLLERAGRQSAAPTYLRRLLLH